MHDPEIKGQAVDGVQVGGDGRRFIVQTQDGRTTVIQNRAMGVEVSIAANKITISYGTWDDIVEQMAKERGDSSLE